MDIYAHVPWKLGDLSPGYSFPKGYSYVYVHQMSLNIKYDSNMKDGKIFSFI